MLTPPAPLCWNEGMSASLHDEEPLLAQPQEAAGVEAGADAFERRAPEQDPYRMSPAALARREYDGLRNRRARAQEEAEADAARPRPEPAAAPRKGFFGRIGDFFSGLRSRFRNWRLRNSTSAEGSEILTSAIDEIKRTEGGRHTFAEEDVQGRLARQGVRGEETGKFRTKRSRFRNTPMKRDANQADAKRFWDLDFQLNNLGRRPDESVIQSKRYTPVEGMPRQSEAGRAMTDFASKGRGGFSEFSGLPWRAKFIQQRATKEALEAARTGAVFSGLTPFSTPKSRAELARKYGPKDRSQVIPEARSEGMEEDAPHDDDLDSMEFDEDS